MNKDLSNLVICNNEKNISINCEIIINVIEKYDNAITI